MTDVVLISDSEEEMPEPKRQKLSNLDQLESSDDDEVPVADDSSEEINGPAASGLPNAGQSEVSSSDEAILISSSEDEASNSESDIDEGQDLWMDKNIKAARFEPPKKIFSILDGLDQEQEDKCILAENLLIHNLAMPNMNLKTGTRLPVPVVIDRSVAEFFYKRDAVPKGWKFEENMSLDINDKRSLVFKLAASERRENPTIHSFLWFVVQIYDFSYLPYHEMTVFSAVGQNDMRDKDKRHLGIPPFPKEFRCGCSCEDGCRTMKCECRRRSVISNSSKKRVFKEDYWQKEHNFFGYDENGLLTKTTLEPVQALSKLPTVSYSECNTSCRCHDNLVRFCYNGITSDINSRYKTEIFLTKNKGWGYRAAENIPAGAYITEYTGVVQPIADYYEHGTNSTKLRFHPTNAVEMLDSYFRKSLTLIPDGEKVNKFDKESVLCDGQLFTDSQKRKYMFNVDPIHDIVADQIERKKGNPMEWLQYKMEDREEIEIDFEKRNSSRVLKKYAYDQAYYGSFTIDAAKFGNEARFINGCCKKEYSNVQIVLIEDERQDQRFPKITFFTCKDVKAGEEFQYYYGYTDSSKYYTCDCNGSECIGKKRNAWT